MTILRPALRIDGYKFDHRRQYPEGTTRVYSNFTPRSSRIPGVDSILWFGYQAAIDDMAEVWEEGFFSRPKDVVVEEYQKRLDAYLGPNDVGTDHIAALHDLGYLPLVFRALPEGTEVPLRVPTLTIENTHPDFFWLVNYIESDLSAELWLPTTTATLALRMRKMLDAHAAATSDTPEAVDFQAHDFSYRGMTSVQSAAKSGAGHLLSFAGTDTVPSLDFIEHYYSGYGPVGLSVPATEHSVMSAGGQMGERETFEHLLDLYPAGIVSVVSDTWDLWNVILNILPQLKDRIMSREGKLVIRPDSGDPVDILCGTQIDEWVGHDGYRMPARSRQEHERNTPEEKGVIELLWEVFGGTVNSKGYKVLDPHIGAIYGDSITYERADTICKRLAEKGFASTNVVFGVGSFSYQYNTRDTFGWAMKATWAEVNGEGRDLFKAPKTDNGVKNSARGRLGVFENDEGLYLAEQLPRETEESHENRLREVWENGSWIEWDDWSTIVDRVDKRFIR